MTDTGFQLKCQKCAQISTLMNCNLTRCTAKHHALSHIYRPASASCTVRQGNISAGEAWVNHWPVLSVEHDVNVNANIYDMYECQTLASAGLAGRIPTEVQVCVRA